MIVLPWFVRFSLDCTVALTPIIYLHYHPTTFLFQYFQNRRRLVRRKTFEDFQHLNNDSTLNVQEVKALYKDLGIDV